MSRVSYAVTLIAEATAHGIEILYSSREIGISYMRRGSWEPMPDLLLDDLDEYANEIWAILHPSREVQP